MNSWGYCYLILFDEKKKMYKIGYSRSAEKRMRQLQNTNLQKLYIVSSCYCYHPKLLEKLLHQKFGKGRLRKKNEFFKLTDKEVIEICQHFKTLANTHITLESLKT